MPWRVHIERASYVARRLRGKGLWYADARGKEKDSKGCTSSMSRIKRYRECNIEIEVYKTYSNSENTAPEQNNRISMDPAVAFRETISFFFFSFFFYSFVPRGVQWIQEANSRLLVRTIPPNPGNLTYPFTRWFWVKRVIWPKGPGGLCPVHPLLLYRAIPRLTDF